MFETTNQILNITIKINQREYGIEMSHVFNHFPPHSPCTKSSRSAFQISRAMSFLLPSCAFTAEQWVKACVSNSRCRLQGEINIMINGGLMVINGD
jgi:hypothetical protein